MTSLESATSEVTHDASRLKKVALCVEAVETLVSRCNGTPNVVERDALERSKEQLRRVESQYTMRRRQQSGTTSEEDRIFGDRFLDTFTTDAFSDELDALRQAEGKNMTESDFATLADSIRSFGIGISAHHREILFADSSPS